MTKPITQAPPRGHSTSTTSRNERELSASTVSKLYFKAP